MSLRQDVYKDLKTTRDIMYEKVAEASNYAAQLHEQERADLAYIAMMSDIPLDEGDDDDE